MNEQLLNQVADALQIISGCSPIQSELEAMPNDEEITLTFCAEDLKEIRAALFEVRKLQPQNLRFPNYPIIPLKNALFTGNPLSRQNTK